MRKRVLLAVWVTLLVSIGAWSVQAAESERLDKLELILERAVDLFDQGRIEESRAELNKLIAEDPTSEEAYELRRLFGHRVLLNMQAYSVKPQLTQQERDILTRLTQASVALQKRNISEAAAKMTEIAAAGKARYPDISSPYETTHANEIKQEILALQGKDFDTKEGRGALRLALGNVDNWRERLQSLGNGPLLLLTRAQRFEQNQMRSPERIKEIVAKAVRDPEGSQRYLLDLARLGPYAVPELIEYLQNDKETFPRTNAAVILTAMGSNVVVPLAEALNTDSPMLQQQIIEVINRIRPVDPRAIASIKRIYDNPETKEPVRRVAARALETITGAPAETLPAAQNFYFAEANRYYLGGDMVEEQLEAMNNTFWVWDPKGGAAGTGGLRELRVPAFALDDMMAEEMSYDGMALAEDDTPFQIMLASIFLQQKREIDMLEKVTALQDLTLPLIDELKVDVNTWSKRLYKNLRIAYTLGPQHLITVVKKAMHEGKPEVAIGALNALTVIGKNNYGWDLVKSYKQETGILATERPTLMREKNVPGVPEVTKRDIKTSMDAVNSTMPDFVDGGAKTAGNPVLQALYYPNQRVRVAAANCLVRIGLPPQHPVYKDLLPVLLSGAAENKVLVALTISSDFELRNRIAADLELKNVLALTADSGVDGLAAATTYPPKDVIFLDGNINEFSRLKDRLELFNVPAGAILPLTIITSRNNVPDLVAQFAPEKIKDMAKDRQTTVNEMLDRSDNSITDLAWLVEIRHDARPAQKEAIFEDLVGVRKYAKDKRPVVILTNESLAEREQLKNELKLRAERSLRPASMDRLALLRRTEKVLGDNWGATETFAPVFLGSDLGGMDVMKTVQALYTDPRTKPVPVVILSTPRRIEQLNVDFKPFIDEGHVQVVENTVGREQVFALAEKMSNINPLSKEHYARKVSNTIATESATGISELNRKQTGLTLTVKDADLLTDIVEDKARPISLRAAAANALGHFQSAPIIGRLQEVFRKEEKEHVGLRVAVLEAIGRIDVNFNEMDFMSEALFEPDIEIQEVAGTYIGIRAQNNAQRETVVDTHRPNDPLDMLDGKPVAGPAKRDQPEGTTTTPPSTTTPTPPPVKDPEPPASSGWGDF